MLEWLQSLNWLELTYLVLGGLATVFLIIQIIMMLVGGMADVDLGGDIDTDVSFDVDAGDGLDLFTVKPITAFLAIGGWVGLTISQATNLYWLSVICFIVSGVLAMVLVALALRGIAKMQCSGNLIPERLIGEKATVYVSIASNRTGRGKITLTAQGKYTELDAVTDDGEKLAVDTLVEIVSMENEVAVVRRI